MEREDCSAAMFTSAALAAWVVRVSSEGEAKGILLDLISFYRDCVPADESYQAVLMDRSGSALIHPRDGGIAVELARKQEYDPVWDALENQEESRSATMGEDSWMGVIPAELSGNGYFTIGILGSVPEGMLWVPGAMGLLCCMLLAAGCNSAGKTAAQPGAQQRGRQQREYRPH